MEIFDSVEWLVATVVNIVQTIVGDLIYDFTGITTSYTLNAIIGFYGIGFAAILAWALLRPHESIYRLD